MLPALTKMIAIAPQLVFLLVARLLVRLFVLVSLVELIIAGMLVMGLRLAPTTRHLLDLVMKMPELHSIGRLMIISQAMVLLISGLTIGLIMLRGQLLMVGMFQTLRILSTIIIQPHHILIHIIITTKGLSALTIIERGYMIDALLRIP